MKFKKFLILFLLLFCQSKKNPTFKIFFIDVGHGDAILIKIPNNKKYFNILIDGGERRYSKNILIPFLENEKVDTFHYIFVTHNHSDHLGGILEVLDNFSVSNLITSQKEDTKRLYLEFLKKLHQLDLKPKKIKIGESILLGPKTKIKILNCYKEGDDENNSSLVLKLVYDTFHFLFTGDIEGKKRKESSNVCRYTEKFLCERFNKELKSKVLKVPHHGSETSLTDTFLKLVSPEIAIVTAGRRRFGKVILPDTTVILRLLKNNVKIFRTDKDDYFYKNAPGDDHILIEIKDNKFICQYYHSNLIF
ncbi:MAG: MBL fold metallo-hydrolase [candidate division WOR-3 bacterium]|nr:MBL fold metallo-hydrolase [candidate division WOR-3 bacterium]MCX7836998.1 MBL fold metallo-hydrolase [candidate division WOR-3 bacterium]MDW8114076.1 MBL fold metallo-hydrolase [candidate division WOR-3 bacterium]